MKLLHAMRFPFGKETRSIDRPEIMPQTWTIPFVSIFSSVFWWLGGNAKVQKCFFFPISDHITEICGFGLQMNCCGIECVPLMWKCNVDISALIHVQILFQPVGLGMCHILMPTCCRCYAMADHWISPWCGQYIGAAWSQKLWMFILLVSICMAKPSKTRNFLERAMNNHRFLKSLFRPHRLLMQCQKKLHFIWLEIIPERRTIPHIESSQGVCGMIQVVVPLPYLSADWWWCWAMFRMRQSEMHKHKRVRCDHKSFFCV